MQETVYEIRDRCRSRFLPYLFRAIDYIPKEKTYKIIDIGCGTGVPTLALAEIFKGTIFAVDLDSDSLKFLEYKIKSRNLSDRIKVFCQHVSTIKFPDKFDIVLSEGLLNVIGFEKGISIVNQIINKDGFFIIHDEFSEQEKKKLVIKKNGYKLLDFFILDEKSWWNNYYSCLEKSINNLILDNKSELFKSDLEEIRNYKNSPHLFQSNYYILKKIS